MSLLDDDQATVDRIAAGVPSVIDALVALVPPERRAALEPKLPVLDLPWLTREGDAGAFVAAAHCRRELAELERFGRFSWPRVIDRVRLVLRRFEGRPIGAWIWAELLGAVPSHKRTATEYLAAMRTFFGDGYVAAARHAIRNKVSGRGILFERLRREDRLSLDEILAALGDPPLRATAIQLLEPRVIDVESELRARLPDATQGEREAIVRLLRTVDQHVDQSGESSHTNLGELEARLRVDPTDAVTAQVWADLLQDAGDPRGALLALDLAMLEVPDHARMLELSAERAAIFARDRKAIFGKPGGWPFCDKYLGRTCIAFGTSWRATLRGKPDTVRGKVMQFLAEVTDCEEPTVEGNTIRAHFKLTWPGTRTPLPYQEDGHYPEGFRASSLVVNTEGGKLEASLRFPFERFDDPHFEEVYEAIAETLGKIALTPSGFSIVTPTADGKKLKSRRQRYAGPQPS